MRRQELARERFERMYREHASGLYAYLRWWCGNDALAEDLLADVFERVLRSAHRYDPRKARETTWLYAIAINRVRDHARRGAAERRAVSRLRAEAERAPVGAASVERAVAARDEIATAMGRLSDEEREVIALRFGSDLAVADVAEALGEPLTTVEGRLYRGLQKLREELRQ
jgi:RNA polymerase sigma-70 factor, ECF subfamily